MTGSPSRRTASPVLHALNYLLGELAESYLSTCLPLAVCRATPAVPRTPPGGLLHRISGYRRHGAHLGCNRPPLCGWPLRSGLAWAPVLTARRRRTRRGLDLGDGPGPDGRRSRRNRVRHRSHSAVPGPVVPGIAADRLQRMFGAAGWQVVTSRRRADVLFTIGSATAPSTTLNRPHGLTKPKGAPRS
jgi:pyruvate dehydrogenase E1 component